MDISVEQRDSWLERPLIQTLVLNWEILLFVTILVVAVFTRFYDLEPRVMSHDENSHVYYSWLLYRGQGYTHDPITHGPFQFHVVALAYFLFGDSDTTARIPVVLFSIATVAFMWNFRRYLGRVGALVAGVLLVISPYMLFYGRYVRNEAYVALWGVITIWAILRYLETGGKRYLLYLTAASVLHFTTKETSFIYTAQALIFLGLLLLVQVSRREWARPKDRNTFLVALLAVLLLFVAAGATSLLVERTPAGQPAEAGQTVEDQDLEAISDGQPDNADAVLDLQQPLPVLVLGAVGLLAGGAALFFLIRGYTWERLKNERTFDLIVILFTPVIPMLAPFPAKLLGLNPTQYSDNQTVAITAALVVLLALVAAAIGLVWKPRVWLLNMALFYAIFTVLYTTVFTNGFGFFTGLVGSLSYWLDQQPVNRGSQPFYYYFGLQVPVYEFLPAIGSVLALVLYLLGRRSPLVEAAHRDKVENQPEDGTAATPYAGRVLVVDAGEPETPGGEAEAVVAPPVLPLLGFWAVTSLAAYTVAGEKMPWLTVHITLPMILLSGWSIGTLIESINWRAFRERRGWLVLALLPAFLASLALSLYSLLGPNPPFMGQSLDQLRATTTFVVSLIFAFASGIALSWLSHGWPRAELTRLLTLAALAGLGLLTARAAFRAAYIHYDNPTEYLVYAHSAPGVKLALSQIEEISRRTTDGLGMPVAYDNETTYPFWWYLRNYTNQRYYGSNPTRSLREAPVILVGDPNYGKIEAVVRDEYLQFDYKRLWWPDQDYYNLTWDRIRNVIVDPQWRSAVFQIWLNRDYTQYAQLAGKDMSLPNWEPAAEMRLYVRKDIAAEIWNYGSTPAVQAPVEDPYAGKELTLAPDRMIGSPGANPGELQRPRDLALASDGSLYVTDTNNHRIQHFGQDGSVIQIWGSFSGGDPAAAPPGTFNEPWGIAVGPNGSVYVADTWNHRIQKFSPQGEFLTTWGYFGQAEAPEAFWGPRDVAVDAQGRVYVSDTGNKRIVVFDQDGSFLTQFGQAGLNAGEFDEPVGVTVDSQGQVYVADTWNQRIQVFTEAENGTFQPILSWDVSAWFGQSLDNKPYLATGPDDHVYTTDPEGYRVIEYTPTGEIVRTWGDYSETFEGFGLPGSIVVEPSGGVWVSDTGNSRVLHFTLP